MDRDQIDLLRSGWGDSQTERLKTLFTRLKRTTSLENLTYKTRFDLKTIYKFDHLEFAVVSDFPGELVAIVTDAVLSQISTLPGALPPAEVLKFETLHKGARDAIKNF